MAWALKRDKDETDYILKGKPCWITVDNLSIYIRKDKDGVIVTTYPKGEEDNNFIDNAYALFTEGTT